MNILITGGTGFIGTHLVEKLRKSNMVFVVDHNIGDSDYVSYFECDYNDPKIARLLPQIDVVYHLAWRGAPASQLSENEAKTLNTDPSIEFIDSAKDSGVKHFVFLSSAGAVYGDNQTPFVETQTPKPISIYGKSKLTIENYLREKSDNNFHTTIIRTTNIVHPHQKHKNGQGLIPAIVDSVKKGKPLELWGDSVKDYLSIDDLVEVLVMVKPFDSFNLINVGSGQYFSTKEIISIAEEVIGKSLSVVKKEPAIHDTKKVQVDLKRLKTQTGWQPTTNMKNYIEDVFRKQFENA